ncbi:oocyte zinc finger protein XlCOF6 [Eurosta solidaginis]|uniref:oocyte zinc finger protein XlCOF6 n=1 Tax=Eurosta solidaginis TaxID=178769 RepID=UPI00353087C3
MSIPNNDRICPRCGTLSTENANRLVTDSCGHRKCRRCLLADDECIECLQNSKHPNASLKATKESDALPAANTDEIKNAKKKGRKAVSMPSHILQIQSDRESSKHYYCTRCDKKFTSRSQQYYHLACGNDAEKKYKCQQCDKAFSTSSHLNYHLESHNENAYNCKHCNKSFTNRMVLRKHEKHHRSAPFKCVSCHNEFRSKCSLFAHISKWHDDKELPFKCTECEKSYALKSTLKQHMQKHFDKKYACQYCDKRFQRNYTLKLHLMKHTRTDSFICSICLRKFSDAAVLLRHVKLHQDTIKYYCKECSVSIVRKDNMLRHIRTIHPGQTFENCVEISQPNNSSVQNEFETETALADLIQTIEPKTVDNSAVIKCIGNVEPIKIPTCTTFNTPLLDANIKSTQSVCDTYGLTSTISDIQPSLPVNGSDSLKSAVVGHKKIKKKYDPIKMYRKILATDYEDESIYESENEKEEINSVMAQDSNIVMTPAMEKRVALTTSNFSEMHWRKNFKYTYEYQDI